MKGYFLDDTVDAFFNKNGPKFTAETVKYYLFNDKTPQFFQGNEACVTIDSSLATFCPPALFRILYMDVGLWAGDGGGAMKWPKYRDFGVVSGKAAALCSFVDPKPGEDQRGPITDAEAKQNTDFRAIKTLLDHINKNSPKTLGTVKLRKMLLWSTVNYLQLSPPANRIYVFLGDMHAPVMTELSRSFETDRMGRMSLFDTNFSLNSDRASSGPMRVNDAKDWFDDYHGTSSSISADIFQSAGQDLSDFLKMLLSYQKSIPTPNRPIHLVQTGDLFEFWIGLVRYFEQHADDVVFDSKWESNAERFVKYWIDETLDKTTQGRHIRDLLTATDLNSIFLYGNHDNYLKKLPKTTHNSVSKRNACYHFSGLYAEHGHRSDDFNRDGETNGWIITQLAFHHPNIRNYQEKASKLFAQVRGNYPQRLIHIGEAVDTCMGNSGISNPIPCLPPNQVCSIYVMGHTHEGFLRRIDVHRILEVK